MSAGAPVRLPPGLPHDPALTVVPSLDPLAPAFRAALELGLADCAAAGLDAVVAESLRSQALQMYYYRRGRPPTPEFPEPVTYAADAMRAWHFYGLAVDIVSRTHGWFAVTPDMTHGMSPAAAADIRHARARQSTRWFAEMAAHMKACGLAWGGDWRRPDRPHIQWGRCRPSPSDVSITAYTAAAGAAARAGRSPEAAALAGRAAVWRLVLAA